MQLSNESSSQSLNLVKTDFASIQNSIEEIELFLKTNYNSMIQNVMEFKMQLHFYLNLLKDAHQKVTFLLQISKNNVQLQGKLLEVKSKIEKNKEQIALVLRTYELKNKSNSVN